MTIRSESDSSLYTTAIRSARSANDRVALLGPQSTRGHDWANRSGYPSCQLISMSCPRAGPVGSLFRSMLKNGSTFMPSGPTCTSRT